MARTDDRVALPALLGRLVDPADAIDGALDRAQDRAQEGPLALHDPVDVRPRSGVMRRIATQNAPSVRKSPAGTAQKSSGRSSAQSR